uniref:P-type Zn(2+) transporter n=1 Tax=Vibrio coralliilyticus TaxID=190893 RepID=M1FVA1_9VIBR|nr:heavy metal-(Cd/Co/Hg/Pb/Zn)-translocating P-type ATPase [Vibrio coralliilyticus]
MDVPSEHAKATIDSFREQGVHTTLITGDSKMTGKAVAKQLGIDEVIANVMPEDKSRIIDEQKEKYGVTAMVGDGVNDAPALVNAHVGIAMGDGTDVAVEVSDLVLMPNNFSKVVQSHKISYTITRFIGPNIIFSIAVVAFLFVVIFLGSTDIAIRVIIPDRSSLVVILYGILIPEAVKRMAVLFKLYGKIVKPMAYLRFLRLSNLSSYFICSCLMCYIDHTDKPEQLNTTKEVI